MTIGAWSAGLLVLAAPATAAEAIAQPAPASSGAEGGSAESAATPEQWDGVPSAAPGRVVVMTLGKPRPEPQPRAAADPRELSKHALSRRPAKVSN
jgi:hypothetical protein